MEMIRIFFSKRLDCFGIVTAEALQHKKKIILVDSVMDIFQVYLKKNSALKATTFSAIC